MLHSQETVASTLGRPMRRHVHTCVHVQINGCSRCTGRSLISARSFLPLSISDPPHPPLPLPTH